MADDIQNFLRSDLSKLAKPPKSMRALSEQWFWWAFIGFAVFWLIEPALLRAWVGFYVAEPTLSPWQWGYANKSPLLVWMLNISYLLPGSTLIWEMVCSQVLILIGFIGVWKLAQQLLTPAAAFAAAVTISVLPTLTIGGHTLCSSFLLFSMWPWLYLGVQQAVFKDKAWLWPVLGVGFAVAWLGGYLSGLLLLGVLLFTFINNDARQVWLKPTWYVAWVLGLCGIALNLLWLLGHDMSVVQAWQQSAVQFSVFYSRPMLWLWAMLVLGALLMLLVLMPFMTGLKHSHPVAANTKQWLIATMGLPISVALVASFFATHQYFLLWQPTLWLQVGVLLLLLCRPVVDLGSVRRFGVTLLLTHLGLLIWFNYLVLSGH